MNNNSLPFNQHHIRDHLQEKDPIITTESITSENPITTYDSVLTEKFPTYARLINDTTKVYDKMVNPDTVSITNALQDMITKMNAEYGTTVKLDFTNFSSSLEFIIDPSNKRVVELFLSEIWSSFRITMYVMMMNAVAVLGSQIFDPKFLSSNSYTYSDKFSMVKELLSFMKEIEEITAHIKINASHLELTRIHESVSTDNLNDPAINNFLKLVQSRIIKNNDK